MMRYIAGFMIILASLGAGAHAQSYRGTVNVLMLGRWDVTVSVSKDGQRVGSKQTSLVAR